MAKCGCQVKANEIADEGQFQVGEYGCDIIQCALCASAGRLRETLERIAKGTSPIASREGQTLTVKLYAADLQQIAKDALATKGGRP